MSEHKNENGLISFHLGCDLGKESDYTAVCFLRKFTPLDRRGRKNGSPTYEVLMMKRFALKTSYVSIVREISNRLRQPPFDSWQDYKGVRHPAKIPLYLTYDKTGVGAAVAELLQNDQFLASRLEELRAVNITAGRDVNETSDALNIPKRDLIMATVIAFEKEQIEFAGDLPELVLLVAELQNFEMRFTAKGNDTYSATGANHDDMVIALSLAVYSARMTDESFDEEMPLKKALSWSGKQAFGGF